MTVSELVTRGMDAYNGGNYAKATALLLMASLVTGGVPAERFDDVSKTDLKTADPNAPKPFYLYGPGHAIAAVGHTNA